MKKETFNAQHSTSNIQSRALLTSHFVLLTVLLLLPGCTLLRKAYTPVVTTTPGVLTTNVVWQTNQVTLPPVTNAVTGAVTPAQVVLTAQPVTNIVVVPGQNITNWVVNPNISSGIKNVGDVAQVSGVPWSGPATAVALFLYGVGASILNIRNKKKSQAITSVLVDNVESARDVIKAFQPTPPPGVPTLDQTLVAKIKDDQQAMGVRTEIHEVVKG